MSAKYVFSHNQLKVLVLGCGYSHITGLYIDDSSVNNEVALKALNQLSNEGMITSDGKRFFASEQAKLIAKRLGTAGIYIAVHTSKEALSDLCCFPGSGILVCSSKCGDENCAVISISEFEDFFSDLCDEGYLPYDSEDITLNDEELEEYEQPLFEEYDPNAPISTEHNILFSAELIDKYGLSHGYLRVIAYYFYNYILFFNEGKSERNICTAEKIKGYLKRLMNQE